MMRTWRPGMCVRTAAFACALVNAVSAAGALHAQGAPARDDCALPKEVPSLPGATGYARRSYGCEGFYVQPQASVNIQVLSLRRGALELADRSVVFVAVPPVPDSLARGLKLYGNSLPAGLNWALDAEVRADRPMAWSLSEVVMTAKLPSTSIGLVARTTPRNRFESPVWVAVSVSAARGAAAAAAESATQLVVRIPAAGRMRWRAPGGTWTTVTDPNGDGRFVCELPTSLHGHVTLELQWAPRVRPVFGDSETLQLFLW